MSIQEKRLLISKYNVLTEANGQVSRLKRKQSRLTFNQRKLANKVSRVIP